MENNNEQERKGAIGIGLEAAGKGCSMRFWYWINGRESSSLDIRTHRLLDDKKNVKSLTYDNSYWSKFEISFEPSNESIYVINQFIRNYIEL